MTARAKVMNRNSLSVNHRLKSTFFKVAPSLLTKVIELATFSWKVGSILMLCFNNSQY